MWDGVMAVPEARAVNDCMTTHTECMTYSSLRKEAQDTLDPSDPAYFMYHRHITEEREEGEETEETEERVTHGKERKKERLIVIPEFVENLDTGDGSKQFEEEYEEEYEENQI